MANYQITDLEKLSGIKAHTIRIWEKRFGIIEPQRSLTNIRFYNDDQVKKLLKISTLIASGAKISKIADLGEKELNKMVSDLFTSSKDNVVAQAYISDLIASMLAFDGPGFEKTFSAASQKFGVYNMMISVIYPFLHKTGLMWSLDEAMPVQEHFATAIIRRKLITAIDGLPLPTKRSKVFVLFLPEGEWHETGLLLSDYLIRHNGYKTIYLGQNVPASNIKGVIKATKPTHLLSIYITRKEPIKIEQEISSTCKLFPNLSMLVAGTFNSEDLKIRAKNFTFLKSPDDLQAYL